MKNTSIIFMGTPEFAQQILLELLNHKLNIIATVSQPDRRVGRKQNIEMTPVKALSVENDIECIQPFNIKEQYQEILALKPDLIITCAYGQIIPKELLDGPKLGCVNIHASLLPRLRGGAPIHKAIMYGESQTGITIMEMSEGMDEGDMISSYPVDIDANETMGSLEKKLIETGKRAIIETLPVIIDQSYTPQPQDPKLATYAYNVSKKEEFISFDREYHVVSNHIRSLIPSPVGYGIIENKNIKIHGMKATDIETNKPNGTLLGLVDDGVGVAVENKVLVLTKVQPAGKQAMMGRDFMNGQGQHLIGKRFD